MTREEQRDTACTNWICSQENGTVIKAREVWKAAVEWADQHPAWVSVEDELPPRTRSFIFSDYVLVCDNIGYMDTACYNFEKNRWDWLNNVTHWMPLPTPPVKKEGEQ